jgi:hypothetical protein
MPLYEMTSRAFRPIEEASFADLKVRERGDLQRLLRSQIEVLGDDLYVLTEEFGEWEDSRRRIDLLAIDKQANLVVIELKRTNDGGHMELQAIRYAAMISAMTFARAVEIHADYLARTSQSAEEAQALILEFLGWDEVDEVEFAPDVRILLVSEDFGIELTTAVLWLREFELDIRCVRLRPYVDSGRQLVDVQQVIPLPEATEYQVKLREKVQVERKKRVANDDIRHRFWNSLFAIAKARGTRHANLTTGPYTWIGAGAGVSGVLFNYSINADATRVELYIGRKDKAQNKMMFDALLAKKSEIENRFGAPLTWMRSDGGKISKITHMISSGGYLSPEVQWPAIQTEMVDAMTKLEEAILPSLNSISL